MSRFSKRRSFRKMKGGSGAAEYAEQVYGSAGNQHAVPNGGNVIEMKQVTGGGLPSLSPSNYRGGNKYKRRSTKKRRSRRMRRSMRR